MKKVKINNVDYIIERDYKDGFDLSELTNKITEYFAEYDYIFGDWSYGKLRLKGFCDKKNKRYNKTNAVEDLDDYIKKYCSYECRYFLIKKDKTL